MKLVIDERLKHRLIGLAVIISLGVIFAPAVMRKSNQHLEGTFSMNIKLPPKPALPEITAVDKTELFKTIKIATVDIPDVSAKKQVSALIKAERITPKLAVAAPGSKSKPVLLALNHSAKKTTVAVKKSIPKPTSRKALVKVTTNHFVVQLASFNQISKAQTLINQLRDKGFKGSIVKTAAPEGTIYKVHVGHSQNKQDVDKLKIQLASTMRLNGFIVNTGVS
ncbi:MAG: SPOR domain-containing protein [Legionellales bacterium]